MTDDDSATVAPTPLSGRSWVRRERWTLVIIGVCTAASLFMAGTLIAAAGNDRPRAEVGDVLLGPRPNEESGQSTEVLLPWAYMDVTVGDPVDELPRGFDERPEVLRAPAGGSFIHVSMKPTEQRPTLFRLINGLESTARVVLTAGGRDYPLNPEGSRLDTDTPLFDFGGEVWVAVDGKPDDVSLAISTEGQTQVVADGKVSGGRSAELVDLPTAEDIRAMKTVGCGPPVSRSTNGLTLTNLKYVDCRRGASFRTPFVDGLGWAEEGRDFLVVFIAMDVRSAYVEDATTTWWRPSNHRVDVTLDGVDSLSATDASNTAANILLTFGGATEPWQYVFDVPSDAAADELEIALEFDAAPTDPFVTDQRHVEVQWRVASGDPR